MEYRTNSISLRTNSVSLRTNSISLRTNSVSYRTNSVSLSTNSISQRTNSISLRTNSLSLTLLRRKAAASIRQRDLAAGVLRNELLYRVKLAVTRAAVGKLNFDRRVCPLENGPVYKRWTSDVDENQDTKN